MQIVGGKDLNLDVTRKDDSIGFKLEANEDEIDWMNLESDIRLWTRALRPVQVNQLRDFIEKFWSFWSMKLLDCCLLCVFGS